MTDAPSSLFKMRASVRLSPLTELLNAPVWSAYKAFTEECTLIAVQNVEHCRESHRSVFYTVSKRVYFTRYSSVLQSQTLVTVYHRLSIKNLKNNFYSEFTAICDQCGFGVYQIQNGTCPCMHVINQVLVVYRISIYFFKNTQLRNMLSVIS